MKKILVLNYEFPPLGGGASPVSYELAQKLSETGDCSIDVVTMGFKDLPKFQAVNNNFNIYRVKCLRTKKHVCYPWEQLTYLISAYFKCKELIKKNKYDVCHAHFIIPTGILALKLKNKFGLEYVITSHGSDVLGYNPRFKKIYPYLINIWRKILDNSKQVTTPSEFLKNQILNVYKNFNAEKINVIPNGINLSKYIPLNKRKVIFSSGRLFENKGFQYLIEAVSNINMGYELHIAGDGPMMGILKEMAEKSKTKVVFHGWLDNSSQEYKELIQSSEIFCLLSDFESFGMVMLEAMMTGAVLITSGKSGSAEIVNNVGIVVSSEDKKEMVKALEREIIKLSNNSELVKEYSNMSLANCKKYGIENIASQFKKIL